MEIEINQKFVVSDNDFQVGDTHVRVTPSLDEDYWLLRVRLTDKQAVVCFPKFGTFGIGFQKEAEWNVNFPFTCTSAEIYAHIASNKGDDSISDEACIEAIETLQAAIKEFKIG